MKAFHFTVYNAFLLNYSLESPKNYESLALLFSFYKWERVLVRTGELERRKNINQGWNEEGSILEVKEIMGSQSVQWLGLCDSSCVVDSENSVYFLFPDSHYQSSKCSCNFDSARKWLNHGSYLTPCCWPYGSGTLLIFTKACSLYKGLKGLWWYIRENLDYMYIY